jgi:Predicted GTPase
MEAKTPEEKIRAIQDFLSSVPKHKGTENLVYWAKRRLAELREEAEKQRKKSKGEASPFSLRRKAQVRYYFWGDKTSRIPS